MDVGVRFLSEDILSFSPSFVRFACGCADLTRVAVSRVVQLLNSSVGSWCEECVV